MADKQKVGERDPERVDLNDTLQVTQVANKFNTSADVREAIKRVGPLRADIERELAKRG